MRRAVVVVLDGMRRDLIDEERTPTLGALRGGASSSFAAHRSMFPSATRVVSASFATGCTPARHELQGNTLALLENGRLVYHDAGHPEFLQHKRRVTGRSLAVPTLAERVAPHGGMILFSNVSPGAAYAHDPDGHGHVYHRAGSFAPGRKRIEGAQALSIGQDAAGESAMTVALHRRGAVRAQAGAGDPVDGRAGRHASTSCRSARPQHLAVLRQADANAARVDRSGGPPARQRRRRAADRLLRPWAPDGVARRSISRRSWWRSASRRAVQSGDVVTPTSGTSTLVYVHPDHAGQDRRYRRVPGEPRLGRSRRAGGRAGERRPGAAPWPGVCDLAQVGRRAQPVWRARTQLRSPRPSPARPPTCICGQHGGLARYEQMPFLMIDGAGFHGRRRVHRADLAHRHRADHPRPPRSAGRRHGGAEDCRAQ